MAGTRAWVVAFMALAIAAGSASSVKAAEPDQDKP